MLPLLHIFLIGLAISIANALQVITGFWSVVIALPFVSIVLGIKNAIIVVTILSYLLSTYILITNYKYIRIKTALIMLSFMLPSLFIGIYIFRTIDSVLFKKCIAIFIIIVSVYNLYTLLKKSLSKKKSDNKNPLSLAKNPRTEIFSYISLLLSGFFQGAISSGGPLAVFYATHHIKDKRVFRTTLCLLWFTLNTLLIISYFYYGIETSLLYTSIIEIPFLILGIIIWEKIYKTIPHQRFPLIVYWLLIIVGICMFIF